jgi:ABC-type phosphate/phosphonate transport system ATPase subunit
MSKGAIVFDGPPAGLTQTVLDRVYAGRMTPETAPFSIVEAA